MDFIILFTWFFNFYLFIYLLPFHYWYHPRSINKIFNKKVKDLYRHKNIISSFLLLGMFVPSYIVYLYESKISKSESNADKLNNSILDKGCYNDIKNIEKKKSRY